MGLFDNVNWNDPALAMAAGLLGAPSLGQGLSRGLHGGMQAQQQAQQNQMRQLLFQSQMEENRAQTEERQARLAEAQRLRQAQSQFWSDQQNQPTLRSDFNMRDPGTWTPPQQSMTDFVVRGMAAGVPYEQLKAIAESKNLGRSKVGRVIDVQGPDGRPMQQQIDEFGQPVGAPMPKPYERRLEDMGGTKQPYDPYTGGLTGTALPKTMTPDAVASNAVARGNLSVAQANLELARQRATKEDQAVTYQADANGNLVALPSRLGPGQMPQARPAVDASGAPVQRAPAPVPQHVSTAMTDNFKSMGVIDQALAQLKTPAGQDATGWKGFLPDAVLNRANPEGTLTRANIADIESMTVKDRSGATVTAAESPRLKPFIPSVRDDTATVIKKLERMKQIIDEDTQMLGAFYPHAYRTASEAAAGQRSPSPAAPRGNATTINGKVGAPPAPTVEDLLRKYGG